MREPGKNPKGMSADSCGSLSPTLLLHTIPDVETEGKDCLLPGPPSTGLVWSAPPPVGSGEIASP